MDKKDEALELLKIGIEPLRVCEQTGLSRYQVYRLKRKLMGISTRRKVAASGRKGPRSEKLRKDQIERLEKFRIAKRFSMPQLNAAIGGSDFFTWQVLQRALRGNGVWELNRKYIADWIESHLPAPILHDGKAAAAKDDAA